MNRTRVQLLEQNILARANSLKLLMNSSNFHYSQWETFEISWIHPPMCFQKEFCFGRTRTTTGDLNKHNETKCLGEDATILKNRIRIQKDLGKLENGELDNKIKFNKDQYKMLCVKKNNDLNIEWEMIG